MKLLTLTLFLIASVAIQTGESGDCGINFAVGSDKYLVAAVTTNLMILELRKYSDDLLLHDVVMSSRYMVPEYNVKDVASDENLEVIVKTRGGGTGISEAHLTVFGVIGDKIVRFGNFVIERNSAFGEGEETYRETLSGNVSFPKKNNLVYHYSQVITEHNKTTVATEAIQRFEFDSKTMKYERIEEPERIVPPDR